MASSGYLPADRTHILSTGGMIRHGKANPGGSFIVATETGILHRLRLDNPTGRYLAANDDAVCRYMKTITPAKLLRTLREGVFEVTVPEDVAARARTAIERMIALG
jgi:quinolinate synthase